MGDSLFGFRRIYKMKLRYQAIYEYPIRFILIRFLTPATIIWIIWSSL